MVHRVHTRVAVPLLLFAFAALAPSADAQTGAIAGRVTETGGLPLAAVRVQATTAGRAAAAVATAEDGNFRLSSLAPGSYSVVVTRIGYGLRRVDNVQVTDGNTTRVDIQMDALATTLNQVVTTATRGAEPEKILESPNAISVVTAEEIATRPSATVTDHLKSEPGLAISSGGIAQANIVSRGFNNAFSTSMLMLQDYRFAGVPSLRVNVPFLFTGTNEDIERIEVLQGPAAALYGPNSGNGVLHVITKSPFTSQGTIATLDGGERSLLRAGLRNAGVLGDKWGYKLSGEYFTARDWEYIDPNEPTQYSASDTRIPAARRGRPVQRDFDLMKYSGEARLDFRPGEDTELITTAGYSMIGSGREITTTFGAAQVKNWSYTSLQERFRHKKFFAQLFFNQSDAGNEGPEDASGTYYLRTGIPVADRSSVLVGQLQQGLEFGRTRVVLGGDYIATTPRTQGTINGRNENRDNIREVGGYVQTTTALTSQLDLLLAGRADVNSRIEGTQLSPRAALVFQPTPTQNFRLTFNRAFNSPASFTFFLDQYSGTTPAPLLPVQILGNPPKQGFQFARSCAGGAGSGLCMRSPYTPGLQPVSAASTYAAFAQALPTIVRNLPATATFTEANRAALLGLLASPLGSIVSSLRPTDAQVGTVLFDLNTRTPIDTNARPLNGYSPLEANFSNTIEAGYKGLIGDRMRVSADAWFQRRPADPTSQVLNPAVLYNPQQLGAFLGQRIGAALVASGVPAATAQAQAAAAAGALTPLMAAIPVGATAFTSDLNDSPMFVFSYQNAEGFVNVSGIDLATDVLLTDRWSAEGTYSWINKNVFEDAPGATALNPLVTNTPKHRGTATVRFDDQVRGFGGELRGRYAGQFPVNSGVFNSYNIGTAVRYPAVPVNAFLDLGFNWRPAFAPGARISLNVTNLLDNKVQSFVGVPEIGRMAITRLQYQF
jgi:outer membrane receptor for ferrienterochelin and colicin